MEIIVYDENVTLTRETILKTRGHFINVCYRCINEVLTGKVQINNIREYIISQKAHIDRVRSGESDRTLHFIQIAYYIQTGNMVPILHK